MFYSDELTIRLLCCAVSWAARRALDLYKSQSDHFWSVPPSQSEKSSPYSITERRVLELIPVLGSQPAGDVSHKPGSGLPLLSARSAVTPATLKRAATNFAAW